LLYRLAIAVALTLLVLSSASTGIAQSSNDVFNDAVLHDIHLRVNSRDWNTLRQRFDLDTYYPAEFNWSGTTVRDAGIRSRGFGSRNGTKPGLKIEFDRYRDGQRFAGLRSIVLDNHWQDPSMLRERISMRFYQRLGWPAPREAHARLFVNDEYAGLYSIVEDVNEEFLQHHFGAAEETIGSRGYLYEYRWRENYYFAHLGRDLDTYEERFEPKIKAHKSLSELFGPVEEMIRTINDADGDFESRAGEYLDLRDLMTFLAIGNFIADSDGFLGDFAVNNFYLARVDTKRFERFIPWDRDNAFVFDAGNPSRAAQWPIFFGFDQNALARKAIAVPSLRTAYLAELQRAANQSAGWMEGEIARMFNMIRDAAAADPVKPYSNQQFGEAVQFVMRFAQERPGIVLDQVRGAQ
jgi:spore coat protein CotH